MSDFKNILKQLRVKHGLTQEELAHKLGIAKSTVSMYENGKREPDFESQEAIANYFNVDLNYLHGRQETPAVHTIAAHHDSEGWTEEELIEIENFKKYVLSKRNK